MAKAGEGASEAGDYEGKHQGGAGIVRAESGEHENASTDDRADTERRQLACPKGALEAVLAGFTRLRKQHVHRLLYGKPASRIAGSRRIELISPCCDEGSTS